MTKKILLILFLPLISFSQNIDKLFHKRGEINFSFKYNNKIQLNKISDIISIDHKTNSHTAYAYANKKEFKDFLELDIDYDIIKHKPSKLIQSSKSNWNYYPTYDEYVDLMMAFTDSFPSLCKTYSLGTLNSGREILCVQISDNVGQKEDEPSFLYTSSMHGDELAGYILSLRLIDYLLNQYGTNQEITNLINEIDKVKRETQRLQTNEPDAYQEAKGMGDIDIVIESNAGQHNDLDGNIIEPEKFAYSFFVPAIKDNTLEDYYGKYTNTIDDWEKTSVDILNLQELCKARNHLLKQVVFWFL